MADITQLGVVIVTHHNAGTIQSCLNHVLRAVMPQQVMVVDNASADETIAKTQGTSVGVLCNQQNVGFSVACNQGARALKSVMPHVSHWLFLNPDCFLPEHGIDRWLNVAKAHTQSVVLGCRHVDDQGVFHPSSHRRHPNFGRSLARLLGQQQHSMEVAVDSSQAVQVVEAISGAAMFVSADLFDQLSGFDEGYRLHCEDLDLCRRAEQQGAFIAVVNDIIATHWQGTSSRHRPYWVMWQKHRGMMRYTQKFSQASWPLRMVQYMGIAAHGMMRGMLLMLQSKSR